LTKAEIRQRLGVVLVSLSILFTSFLPFVD
jgi:hypothetical protein